MAYNAPHWPLHAHPKDIQKYEGVYDFGYKAIRDARYKRQVENGLFDPKVAKLSEPEWNQWESLSKQDKKKEAMRMSIHAAMVDRVDQNVGRLVKKLRELDKLDNTLILFLVDNGASPEKPNRKNAPMEPWGSVGTFESIGRSWATVANTPLRKWKTSSHEGGANTPLIAHWPQGIANPGRTNREPCHLVDVMPTVMKLAGATYPQKLHGKPIPPVRGISLLPTLKNKPLVRDEPLYWQYGSGSAIRDGKWKLVRSRSTWELYDMSVDRTETNDLAAKHPDRVEQMGKQWNAWYKDCTGSEYQLAKKKKRKSK